MCEVYPTMACVWCVAYERSRKMRRTEKLLEIQPAMDWRLSQTSSWINHITGRDRPSFGVKDGTQSS